MPCKDVAASAEWIDSDEVLATAAESWRKVVGIDTEFQRTDTFFPLAGLYQICVGSQVFLVDPLEVSDFSPLLELLEDRRVTKIMHACSEDLELLRHHIGAVPVGLFDTQLANAFVSTDYSISFTRLVAERLDVELVQHETRSDWLARPLSDEQRRYACEDVYFLPALHASLATALEEHGRLAWFQEEMALRGRFQPADPDTYYQSMAKAWRLPDGALARLQCLTAWRERQAMAEDRPRNRVVRDEHLLSLAQQEVIDEATLSGMLPRGVARRYRDALLEAHDEGNRADVPAAAEAPLGGGHAGLVRDLRDIGRRSAASLGLAPELLSRRREVEACVRHYLANGTLSPAFTGWREPLVGEAFRARLEASE